MQGTRLSVWLLTDPHADAGVQAVVNDLAARHDGPLFAAHMTVFGGAFEGEAHVLERAEALAAETPPLDLHLTSLDVGDTFTKCLIARVAPDARLTPITEAFRPLALPPAAYTFDPHVSLFYGARHTAEEVNDAVPLSGGRVRFDRISVMRSAGPTTTNALVEAWVERINVPLRG